ncbi:hypothetical protein Lal_00019830 [Lupinus albus]|uniref:Putative SNARE associated golgi family protein n=1 Tax=Lupinus albus TaxID=3870 RepID=A0A6A5PSX5_LUPAL|nr:putative SNARE associated golgi family protein [Lupinus albus]KAF1899700.1 hypothetical protein Lal_00019830 [Lupinus albus]
MMRTLSFFPISYSCSSSSSSLLLHHTLLTTTHTIYHFAKCNSNSYKRLCSVSPCSSSLKQTKKQQLSKINTAPPSTIKRLFSPKNNNNNNNNNNDDDDDKVKKKQKKSDKELGLEEGGSTAMKGTLLAALLLVGLVGGFGSVSYIYRDQINSLLNYFSIFIQGYGLAGYALFVAVYAALEILAIPAIPLTMSAGLLFGPLVGTIIVSISGTVAASASFLIARYFARDRILKLVKGNKKFLAIDKAIGENGFRVVTLLRLSPLLPFSLGNYLYGLTSVKFIPYVLGSWLGMLPGSWAYVSAGAFGRAIIQEESEVNVFGGNSQLVTLGLGLLATALAAAYVTRLAKDAMNDIE